MPSAALKEKRREGCKAMSTERRFQPRWTNRARVASCSSCTRLVIVAHRFFSVPKGMRIAMDRQNQSTTVPSECEGVYTYKLDGDESATLGSQIFTCINQRSSESLPYKHGIKTCQRKRHQSCPRRFSCRHGSGRPRQDLSRRWTANCCCSTI